MNISSRSQPLVRFQKLDEYFFEDRFKEIQEKLRALGLVDNDGSPNKKLLSCPLPFLTEEEKKAAHETLKQKIHYNDQKNGVRLTAMPEDIERALDQEMGLSSIILCGSKLIEILGAGYWIRALETAYEFLFGIHIDIEAALGKDILHFLEETLNGASDTDLRNYFKGSYISLDAAQDCVLACLSNLNQFKNKKQLASILKKNKHKVTHLNKCPLDIIRRSKIFDKFTTRPHGFAVVSLQNIEIINIKSLKRSDGILTSGSLKLDLLPLFHGLDKNDIRPESNLGNGWTAIFHIMQGLIIPSDETTVEDNDILKAWRRAGRGHRYGDLQKIYQMLEEFIKENDTPEKIAEKLKEDTKNHLKGSKNGGAALLFHALQSFYKGEYFKNSELAEIIANTQEIWKNSELAPFFHFMCGKNGVPFPSVYAALCFNYLDELGREVKIKLGGESIAVITVNLREGLCGLNLGHIPLLFHEEHKIPIELSLAQKLFRKDKIIFAALIKKLIIRSLEKGPAAQKQCLDTIWHMAKYLLEQQHIELGLRVFSAYIARSHIDSSQKIKGFFRLLKPLVKNSIKISCGSRIIKILDLIQAHSTSERDYLAARCLSLTRHYLNSKQPKQALDLWLYSQSKEYFSGISNEQIHKLQIPLFSEQLTKRCSDSTNKLLHFILNSTDPLNKKQEQTLISLLAENDSYLPDQTLQPSIAEIMKKQNAFETGLKYFSNLRKKEVLNSHSQVVAEFCLECIDKAKEKDMEAANFLFKHLINSFHVKKFDLITQLAIVFADYNLLSDASLAFKCLNIHIDNANDLSELPFNLILEFCVNFIKNHDERFFTFTKQLLPILKHNPQYAAAWCKTIQSACLLGNKPDIKRGFNIARFFISQKDIFINTQFKLFYKDVLTNLQCKKTKKANLSLNNQELLILIKIVLETQETRDLVWTYLSYQAAMSKNSKVKKECWNCFIKVLKPNKNQSPFQHGDAIIYLCYCLGSAQTKDILVMIQHFSKMRKCLQPNSPITPSVVLNAYVKILTSIYSVQLKSQEALKIICDNYSENDDLIKQYEKLKDSKTIRELYCFLLLNLQEQKYFTKGVEVFCDLLNSKSNKDKKWLEMISVGISSITSSPFMNPENPDAELIFTLLLGSVNKEDLDIDAILNSCTFYLKFCQSGHHLDKLSLTQMIELFNYLVQQIPHTYKKFHHKLPAIAKSLVEAVKNNPDPFLLNEFVEVAKSQYLCCAFGKDTHSFQAFFHLILSSNSEKAIFYASRMAENKGTRDWLGNKKALEIECHRKLVHTEIITSPENIEILGDYYIECLRLNCAFELFEEIHSLIMPYLVRYFCLEKKNGEFNSFFKRIIHPKAHCQSFYFENTLSLMKTLLDNAGFGILLKVEGKKNPIKGLIEYFSAYLNYLPKISPEALDIAEQFLECIFCYQTPSKAPKKAFSLFKLLLKKIGNINSLPQMIKADYLIHFEPKHFQINAENDLSLISDLVVSLVSKGSPWGISRALSLLGHHNKMLKESNIELYKLMCLKLNIIFNDLSQTVNQNERKLFVSDIMKSIQHLMSHSDIRNNFDKCIGMLEACSSFILWGKDFCPMISDIYGLLIHKFFKNTQPKPYAFLFKLTDIYLNSVFLDADIMKKLIPSLMEGYQTLDDKQQLMPFMEKFLLNFFCKSKNKLFAYETAHQFQKNIPGSMEIQILATSKVEEGNPVSHAALLKVILKLIERQTPQSFAHAMFLLTLNHSSLFSLNQIKVQINSQLHCQINPYIFLNELNQLLLIYKIEPSFFYDNLISVFKILTKTEANESSSQMIESARMPLFFYEIYYLILFSIAQRCSPDEIPSILQKWSDYYAFLTDPLHTDSTKMKKNEKDQFPLMLYNPFELFKSITITQSQKDCIEQTFLSGIQLLISQYPERLDALQCARFTLNTALSSVISHNSKKWKKTMGEVESELKAIYTRKIVLQRSKNKASS